MLGTDDQSSFSIIRIMLICLSMVYAGIIIAISFVCYKIFTQRIKIKIIYAFYISLIILVLSRAITFFIIGINPGSIKEQNNFSDFLIYLMTNTPDLINSCVYILLVWVFFNIFIYSHVSLSFDINTTGGSFKLIGKNINIGLWIVIAFYCIVFVVLCILTSLKVLANEALPILSSSVNIAATVLAVGYYIYLLIKYSGCPYLNETAEQQVKRFYVILIFWTLARLVSGIACLIRSDFLIKALISELYSDNSSNSLAISVFLLSYCIVTEFIPCLLTLNTEMIILYVDENTYSKKRMINIKVNNEALLIENDEMKTQIKDLDYVRHSDDPINTNAISDTYITITQDFMVKLKDLKLEKEVEKKTKHSFGSIYEGHYMNMGCLIRVIEFDRLSKYNLDEFSQDIDEIMNLEDQNILRVLGVCIEASPKIYIVYASNGISLAQFLYSKDKRKLSNKEKLNLSLKICMGLLYLHSRKISHLHLSNKNIIIDNQLNPKITDYGFNKIKILSSIFLKYRNKNSYSSPEILKLNSTIANNYKDIIEKTILNSKRNNLESAKSEAKSYSQLQPKVSNVSIDDNKSVISHFTENYAFIELTENTNKKNFDLASKKSFISYDIDKALFKADIYSVGLIIWEIFSEVQPFNIPIKEVFNIVVNDNLRPEINKDLVPPQISSLIKKCWMKDINQRIDLNNLLDELSKVKL